MITSAVFNSSGTILAYSVGYDWSQGPKEVYILYVSTDISYNAPPLSCYRPILVRIDHMCVFLLQCTPTCS
jgi:hypothetical protein